MTSRRRHDRPVGPELAVEATGLVKTFGKVTALDGVDLRIPRGGVYGLLGPNGAGKTTTVRILASLQRPSAGAARVFGHDVVRDADAVRRRISLTGQYASVDNHLTGRENLVLLARLFGHRRRPAQRRADELLVAFGLAEAADRLAKTYSGGMRRRLDIAASIVVTPDLLFLDEPTAGLDPRSRHQVWGIARQLVAGGTTIVLTTQYLEEADALADRLVVIDRGRVLAEGTPSELKSSIGASTLRVRLVDSSQRGAATAVLARSLDTDVASASDALNLSARCDDPGRAADALLRLDQAGVAITGFSLDEPSLDEVFLALTGHPATREETPA